jgi:hypothetical protein
MENITVRPSSRILRIVSNANPIGGIKAPDNAAFSVQPQGFDGNRLAAEPRSAANLA